MSSLSIAQLRPVIQRNILLLNTELQNCNANLERNWRVRLHAPEWVVKGEIWECEEVDREKYGGKIMVRLSAHFWHNVDKSRVCVTAEPEEPPNILINLGAPPVSTIINVMSRNEQWHYAGIGSWMLNCVHRIQYQTGHTHILTTDVTVAGEALFRRSAYNHMDHYRHAEEPHDTWAAFQLHPQYEEVEMGRILGRAFGHRT